MDSRENQTASRNVPARDPGMSSVNLILIEIIDVSRIRIAPIRQCSTYSSHSSEASFRYSIVGEISVSEHLALRHQLIVIQCKVKLESYLALPVCFDSPVVLIGVFVKGDTDATRTHRAALINCTRTLNHPYRFRFASNRRLF